MFFYSWHSINTNQLFNFQLTIVNSLHPSSIALANPQLTTHLSLSTSALEPTTQMANVNSPKSPNQMATVQHIITTPSQPTTNSQLTGNTSTFRLNLDSQDQIPILHQNGGSITGSTITSLHQATPIHVPLAMSTSLHSGSNPISNFDTTTTSWNSTSSLSPTMSTSVHQRKLEVKLNAMP